MREYHRLENSIAMGFEAGGMNQGNRDEIAKNARTEGVEESRKEDLQSVAEKYCLSLDDLNSLREGPTMGMGLTSIEGTVNGIEVDASINGAGDRFAQLNGESVPPEEARKIFERVAAAMEERDRVNSIKSGQTQAEIHHEIDLAERTAKMQEDLKTFWGEAA